MNVNFAGLKAHNKKGIPFEFSLSEAMADIIYTHTSSIRYARIADDIYDEKDVDFSEQEIKAFIDIIEADSCHTILAAKLAIIAHLNNLLTSNNEQ